MQHVNWNPADYHASASAQTEWGRNVHRQLELHGSEVIFDLGCGDGRLTTELAERVPHGRVIGFDADPEMIAFAHGMYARENIEFIQSDIRTFSHSLTADIIVSTACLHWIREPERVLQQCRRHLTPGGRIVFQMGGRGNCAELLVAFAAVAREPSWNGFLADYTIPWLFAGPEEYQAFLLPNGFRPIRTELLAKEMTHGSPAELGAWLRTSWMPLLERVPKERRAALTEAVVARHLQARPCDELGRTHVNMVRLEVEAVAV
jgi:trans-aconitate 2-methyltransferase